MQENKGSIIGAITSGSFALLSKIAENFEDHAASYAAAAAVLASLFTIANIIRGWLKSKKD
jgi:hypothetical protein